MPQATRYDQGYKSGWNWRNKGHRSRYPKAMLAKRTPAWRAGFDDGWHDGVGRGQTFEQHQVDPKPPHPKSWRKYEA